MEIKKKTLILGVYRTSGSSNVADFSRVSLRYWINHKHHFKNVLIMRDFKIHFCKLKNEAKPFS